MQAVEAGHRQVEGSSNVRTLAAGRKFKPYDVANPDNAFDEHVIVEIEHEVVDQSYESIKNLAEYENRFMAIPATVPATPHQTAEQPRIDGTQIGIVAGPSGEEIHTDRYGRVKLWFPWDRKAKKDGSDTCWVRVAQNWAGPGYGSQVIPRIGMEVIVSYLDGDPDRPVILGLVPNKSQKVPYDLPGAMTKTVFRSQSHKAAGFNELSFEDDAGKEELFVHAQKDLNRVIKDNETTFVEMGDRSIHVKTGDETKTVESGNLSESIAQIRSAKANQIHATASAGKVGEGVISYTAQDLITLRVGAGQIIMTKEAIVISFGKSTITLTESIIDQVAGLIHLNKDAAG
jgi:type VI secretion system secreted protein VgrG